LAEILAENIQREDADIAARRQAIVLSLWEEICEAFTHGWSYKEIWKGLEREGIVDFGYWAFQHYIRKIRRRLVEAEQGTKPPGGGKTTANQVVMDKPVVPPSPAPPASTRVDIPNFGQGIPPREQKKF
jgi:hypothetical protein